MSLILGRLNHIKKKDPFGLRVRGAAGMVACCVVARCVLLVQHSRGQSLPPSTLSIYSLRFGPKVTDLSRVFNIMDIKIICLTFFY